MAARRSKNWCITVQNPGVMVRAQYAALRARVRSDTLKYFTFQEERAATGTVHFQVYAEFKRPVRMSRVQQMFGENSHCEVRRGSQEQAIIYCNKFETRVPGGQRGVWGIPTEQRGRPNGSRVVACGIAVQSGTTLDELREEFPGVMLKFGDKVVDQYLLGMGERDWAMEIEIYVGPSGSGKSTTAKAENPECYHAPWPTGGRWWWPNYEGQEVVVLDEFRHQVKMDVLLKLFDRHPMWLEAKGRSFGMVSHKLVVTTNLDPRDWYQMVGLVMAKGGSLMTEAGRAAGQQARRDVLEPLARRIREFAKIYDFATGQSYPVFDKVLRTDRFVFNDAKLQVDDFGVSGGSAGGYSNVEEESFVRRANQ